MIQKKRSSAAKLLKHYVFMDGKTRKMVKLQEKLDNIVPNEMFAAKKKNPYYTYKATAINKNGKFDYKFEVTCHLMIKKKQKKHTYSKTVKIGKQVSDYGDIKNALVKSWSGYSRLKIRKGHIKNFSRDWSTILTKRGELDECIRKFNAQKN